MMRTRKFGLADMAAVAILAAAMLLASPVMAAAPTTVVIEGVLTSSGGGAAADGDYDIEFSVYEAKSGGAALWTETAKVSTTGGRFHHALGSVKALDANALAAKAKQWLTLKIGTDPELPRQPLHSALFAMTAGSLSCSGCVGATEIANGSIGAAKAGFAYAGSATKGGPAEKSNDLQCSGCVTVDELKFDKDVDLGSNALKAAKLTSAGDIAAGGTVAAKQFVGDGSKLTGIAKIAGECKTAGEVVKGIKADGSFICVKSVDPTALPADGLDEISNGQLSTQFIDPIIGGKNKTIPDNNPDGMLDIINFPDIGIAQEIEINVDIKNSDTADLAVFLFPPNTPKLPAKRSDIITNYPTKPTIDGAKYPHYVLHMKKQFSATNKTAIVTTFPTKTKEIAGDIHKDWINKNIKGEWRLLIVDTAFLNNSTDGQLNSWDIKIKTLSNKQVNVTGTAFVGGKIWGKYNGSGKAGGVLKVGGGVQIGDEASTCDANAKGTLRYNASGLQLCNGSLWTQAFRPSIYRWAVWSTYSQAHGTWYADNRSELFGGVHPSEWGNGNDCAYQMSSTSEILKTLFTRRGPTIGTQSNAVVYAEEWYSHSSTNSRHAGALFRVRNTTGAAINWTVNWYGTSYGSWGERRSIAVNGVNKLCDSANTGASHERADTLSIPANRTSTVIFIVGASSQSGTRTTFLAYYANSLKLPAGLEFVDDLDTKANGWTN